MAAAATLTSDTLEKQALEVCRLLQLAEQALPADTRPNNVQIAPDTENLTIGITLSLPATFSGTGGTISYTAATYLS